MASDYYEYKSTKGLLSICQNVNSPGFWDLCFNGIPIVSNYIDPGEAALNASKGDFGIDSMDTIFKKIYVPADIRQWRKSKGDYSNGNGSGKPINN